LDAGSVIPVPEQVRDDGSGTGMTELACLIGGLVTVKDQMNTNNSANRLRASLHEIIFEADTPAGKLFDVLLIASIVISVTMVMLDSIGSIQAAYGRFLYLGEWLFTILFTIEYLLRLYSVRRPLAYATSFFGMVDLFAVLPTYLSIFFPGTQYLLVIRILRVLRIFRVLKLVQYLSEARLLSQALRASRRKIIVFLFVVSTMVVIFGALMYLIEDPESGFTSIPQSIYWAIVTLTTVGYGDISPRTGLGQFISAIIMIIGYGIIAVPTGIVTAELGQVYKKSVSTQACPECSAEGHDSDAKHCKYCGARL
jgi:voltage-gated potassium channel